MKKLKRILFKVSGESLMGSNDFGHSVDAIRNTVEQIKKVWKKGVQICLVVGGGNIFRGISVSRELMDRTSADYMGMLATVMNGIALQSALEKKGVPARMLSAIAIDKVCESYIRKRAVKHLENNRVVIFVAGTGHPLFTTDTASVLRSVEMECDAMLKGTQVDGVYSKDPNKYSDAVRYDTVSFDKAIQDDLRVVDPTALTLARDNSLPIIIFKISEKDALSKAVSGKGKFTVIGK